MAPLKPLDVLKKFPPVEWGTSVPQQTQVKEPWQGRPVGRLSQLTQPNLDNVKPKNGGTLMNNKWVWGIVGVLLGMFVVPMFLKK
mgnify:CR=1 FL=1